SATSEQRGALTELGDRCDGNSGIGKNNGFHRDTRPRQGEEFLWRHAWLCLDARGRFFRRLRFEWNQTQIFEERAIRPNPIQCWAGRLRIFRKRRKRYGAKGSPLTAMMAWRRMNSASGRRLAEQPKSLGSAIPTAMY